MRWRRKTPTPEIPLGTYYATLLQRTLHLTGDEAKSHIHVIGKSGSGKSRWLAGFCRNLLRAGFSFTLIDPHGDLAHLVLQQFVADGVFEQRSAFEQITYLDIPRAAKQDRYLRFNVLAQPYDVHTTTRQVLEAIRRAFPELDRNAGNAAPAFEQIVIAGVHTLVANRLPFSDLRAVLLRKDWRDQLLHNVSDELVRSFFWEEYDRWDERERMLLQGSTMRRLFLLLYSPILRQALSATDNLLEYRSILDTNRSLIVNLAVQDPDTRRLLGCLLTVFAEQGAKSRADLPSGRRYGTHFVVLDEFQDFVSQSKDTLTAMLSETRKYGVFEVLSHQTRSQIPERMEGALQNVEVDITFRTGRQDAEQQAKVVGNVDPLAVKHEVHDESAGERTHPAFYSLQEQWEGWAKQILGLKKRSAFVKHPDGRVIKVQSLPMPDPVVDPQRLAAVEQHYLTHCFHDVSLAIGAEQSHAASREPARVSRVVRRSHAA